jgi:hypothetical protein
VAAPATAAQAPPVSNVPPAADPVPQAHHGKACGQLAYGNRNLYRGQIHRIDPDHVAITGGTSDSRISPRRSENSYYPRHQSQRNDDCVRHVSDYRQVNAKPWAQVFLDGTPRRALGQTPLSGVTVPMGGVLIFENPNFTSKSYRITDKDSAIQVDFQ